MNNLFIYYPKCSTCQKAKKWLDENKIEYEERHIIEQNPTEKELTKSIKQIFFKKIKFYKIRGMKYKELKLK